jgi:hypothetical protein
VTLAVPRAAMAIAICFFNSSLQFLNDI